MAGAMSRAEAGPIATPAPGAVMPVVVDRGAATDPNRVVVTAVTAAPRGAATTVDPVARAATTGATPVAPLVEAWSATVSSVVGRASLRRRHSVRSRASLMG